ncbi:MAG: hypothetical protein INR71_16050 [Terriglobus roseus]|nr:hypothetical protein [Terriglobus roseus]
MSTSTLLTSALPSDARAALAQVSSTLDPPTHKITVRFQAIGDAPPLKVKVAKVSASHTFATVVRFLRKRLYGGTGAAEGKEGDGAGDKKAGGGESLFCYVNSVFAPGLDEGVGNLWRVSRSLLRLSRILLVLGDGREKVGLMRMLIYGTRETVLQGRRSIDRRVL